MINFYEFEQILNNKVQENKIIDKVKVGLKRTGEKIDKLLGDNPYQRQADNRQKNKNSKEFGKILGDLAKENFSESASVQFDIFSQILKIREDIIEIESNVKEIYIKADNIFKEKDNQRSEDTSFYEHLTIEIEKLSELLKNVRNQCVVIQNPHSLWRGLPAKSIPDDFWSADNKIKIQRRSGNPYLSPNT